MLEHQRAAETEADAQGHAEGEDEEEEAHTVEERGDADGLAAKGGQDVEHDNGDCIIEERLSKDDAV